MSHSHTEEQATREAKHTKRDWKHIPKDLDFKATIDRELQFEPFAFEKIEIENVPVYTRNLPFSPCIHMRIGFRYGAMHDEPGKEGTAHFLEHMIFDGSDMFADEKETQEFGKVIMLDTLNASTGLFELFVTGMSLPHNFPTALAGIFSMIIAPQLNIKSFEHEKKVITQEAWGIFLNEKRIAYIKKERDNVYRDIPDRIRIASALGWPETVLALTHDDIKNAHKKYFVKENMEIYIAGNLDAFGIVNDNSENTDGAKNGIEKLKALLEEFISKIPNGEKARLPYIPHRINGPVKAIFDHTYEEVGISPRQQASITLASHIPRIDKKPDAENTAEENKHMATLTLAGDLLADLVFRKLRLENSWCYGAGASSTPHTDYLSFNMGGSIAADHVDEAISILWNIVNDIKKGEFRPDFEKTKKLAIDNTIARERTTNAIIDYALECKSIDGKISTLKESLYEIAEVEFEDVQKIIADYFTKEKVFTEIVRPGLSEVSVGEAIAGAAEVGVEIE